MTVSANGLTPFPSQASTRARMAWGSTPCASGEDAGGRYGFTLTKLVVRVSGGERGASLSATDHQTHRRGGESGPLEPQVDRCVRRGVDVQVDRIARRSDEDRLDVMPACREPVGQPLQVAHPEQYGAALGDRVVCRLNVQLGRVDTDPARLECHLDRVDDEVQSLFDRA